MLFSGCFALFLSARQEFLPHDIVYLSLTPEQLCRVADCRVVGFMLHDRVAFGGTLIAIAILYMWLVQEPLSNGQSWAWAALAVSGAVGFLSFLTYLGYGYLDMWHGVATLALAPVFVVGIARSRHRILRRSASMLRFGNARERAGRWALLATGGGMVAAGFTIMIVGMTRVFVPQDLAYMGLGRDELHAISSRLIPLIAHDRAGFGGGLASCGSVVVACALYASGSRAQWQALALSGTTGFGAAIGVHLAVGYTDILHLGPAFAGAGLFAAALALLRASSLDSAPG